MRKDKEFWKKHIAQIVPSPCNSTGKRKQKSINLSLGSEYTGLLLNETQNAFNTDIQDLLISSLVESIYGWKRTENVVINMEGHGRGDLGDEMNISSTVGWFTVQYPLSFTHYDDMADNIISVKETLRSIPHSGMTFGLLYSPDDYVKPDIAFNYMGEFSTRTDDSEGYTVYSPGNNISEENDPLYNIMVNGTVVDGIFNVQIMYVNSISSDAEMKVFADLYLDNLRKIISFCASREESTTTISDLDEGVSENEMEFINSLF